MLPANGGPAFVEVEALRRPISSVSAADYAPTGQPPHIPLHLVEIFSEEVTRIAKRTGEAALVAPTGRGHQA